MSQQLTCTVALVGAGSMGGAVARGIVESGVVGASRVLVADHHEDTRLELAERGMAIFPDEASLPVEKADVVVLAVKPQVMDAVMAALRDRVAGALVVSVAAGVSCAAIERALPGARVVRAMPNLPVQVRSGATAVAAGASATPADLELACELFGALGVACRMGEDQLEVAGSVVGTSPAFFSLFVDTLTRAGVAAGLPSEACRAMLEATMAGCARQLLESGTHPRAYVEGVTSPGGTTAAALRALEPALFSASFAAVDAANARAAELAGSQPAER